MSLLIMFPTHKVSDQHLQHECQQPAAIAHHWHHQLPPVGIEEWSDNLLNIRAKLYKESSSWISNAFLKAKGRLK